MSHPLGSSFDENVRYVNEAIGTGTSFDIIFKEFTVGKTKCAVWYVNGFGQDLLQLEIMKEAVAASLGEHPEELLQKRRFSYPPTTTTTDLDTLVLEILSGPMGVVVEGSSEALILDTRKYPDRNPSEPETERVIKGPQDGFVETLLFNAALIRRRMRDPNLRFEVIHVGKHTQMDVAVAYIKGYTSDALVQTIKEKLKNMDVAGITMAAQAVEENLGGNPWNPFPIVRQTQRPDVVAENLMEGRVAIMVDTSPMTILAPATYLSHLHHPEDYHVTPAQGTFLRWISLAALLVGTWLTPVWLVLALHPIPALNFIGPSKPPTYSLLLQLLIAEFGIDTIRRAVLNSPSILATSMSILAAVVLGQLATKAAIFTPEVLVYSAIVAVSLFAVPSVELSNAHRLLRIALLVLGGLLSWWGLAAGFVGLLVWLLSMNSFGLPYLWPLIPFEAKALATILLRKPLTRQHTGPGRLLRLKPRGAV